MTDRLEDLRNVGPKVAERLRALGIERPADLRGRDPEELFARSCEQAGVAEDPCLLDTYAAAVDQAEGKPARAWWTYSRERLARSSASR